MIKITLYIISILAAFNLYAAVIINELNYNPIEEGDTTEFIELWNTGNETIDISGWYFNAGIDYIFETGVTIAPGGFLVIARYTNEFNSAYPNVNNVYGPFASGSKLSNNGEKVSLCNSNGNVVCSFVYDDKSPWPVKADGDGSSLELIQPLLSVSNATSWAASLYSGGTPGDTNSTYLGGTAVITRGTIPAYPLSGQTISVIAEVIAPTSVVSFTMYYSTNRNEELSVTMYDDGAHNDGTAGDSIFGGNVSAMPDTTYVWYYFKLILTDETTTDFPPKKEIDNIAPSMTVRLSYDGLHTEVVPKSIWQVATRTGVATSSHLYLYLNDIGEVLVDDISIKHDGVEYIQNGDFTSNDSGWSKTGNHSGSVYDPTNGYSSAGCEKIISTGVGGSSINSLNRYTTPSLQQNSTIYTLTFAYRTIPKYERDWYCYYVGPTNWHNLCINEFMSWNESFLSDKDGDYSDWIEIYNSGSEPLNLYGCGLSDDKNYLNKWEFPPYVLNSNSYLLIFASGKNRTNSEFHTNFKIKSEGEPLFLSSQSGKEINQTPSVFIPANKSYGCLPNGKTNLFYFETPTPNNPNNGTTYTSVAETPQFSRSGGYFIGSLSLTLSVNSATAEIRYTINGTTPTKSSLLYTSPKTISSTVLVRARVFDTNSLPGNIVSHKYYLGLPSGVLSSSTLPIIVLDSFGRTIPDEPKITARMGVIWNTNGSVNSVMNQFNDYDGKIGIEIRGQSSLTFPKKQYGIEFRNNDNEQIKSSLLGLPAESDWVLNGPYSDKSLMRNAISYYTERQMIEYAPRTKFCEVILNGAYNGVYLLIEKIARSKNRINIDKLEPYENSEPDISGGYIIKRDKTDGDPAEAYFETANGARLSYVYPKYWKITSEQKAWILDYINQFENAILSAPNDGVVAAAEKYVDVNSFVDNYVHVQFTRNIDGFRISSYMYKNKNKKLFMSPQWDYNLSFGNADYLDGWKTNGWYTSYDPFWWREFLYDTNFVRLCGLRWMQLRKNILTTSNILQLVDSNVFALGKAPDRNFARWNILGTYVWPNWYIADTYDEEITWMKNWIVGRCSWLDSPYAWDIATADFVVNKTIANPWEELHFQNTGLGSPDNYYWNFGDAAGWQSNVSSPNHLYSSSGFYTVTLKVDNNSAMAGFITDTTVKTNYVHILPEPGFLWIIGLINLWIIARQKLLIDNLSRERSCSWKNC
ncbi:MAG: hypothetical protein DRI44_04745 [Chlamydiae bacterium]|nr:MAG: hypothetical protein DRI44_04745 [Chlamydiota bacterium]